MSSCRGEAGPFQKKTALNLNSFITRILQLLEFNSEWIGNNTVLIYCNFVIMLSTKYKNKQYLCPGRWMRITFKWHLDLLGIFQTSLCLPVYSLYMADSPTFLFCVHINISFVNMIVHILYEPCCQALWARH